MRRPPEVVGLELTPHRFVAAAGHLQGPDRLVVDAVESAPAQGFEREGLSDPIECADAIARLLRLLERALTVRISTVTAALPSHHLKAFNASASVPIPDPAVGISRPDVDRAIGTCRSLSLEYDRQILHAFERGFSVDGQSGIRNPIGLSGKKLSVELHLVTALNSTVQNFTRVLHRAGLDVEGFVLPALGSADAVLKDLDRDLGVTLIRIGDFQTEIVLFDGGQVRETFLLSGGTESLVESLSRSLKIPRMAAERLFEQVRSVEEPPAPGDGAPHPEARSAWASVPLRAGIGGSARSFPRGEVVHVVRTRARDLLHRIHRVLVASPIFLDSAAGVVMVGHLPRLEGFLELAEGLFNTPVRLGGVRDAELAPALELRTADLTAVGLLRYSFRQRAALSGRPGPAPIWRRPLEKVQQLLEEYF